MSGTGTTDPAGRSRKYDLLLQGGRVIDPAKQMDAVADIAIERGIVVALEPTIDPARARRTIDLRGLIVCPGLIDLHVHCNLYRTSEALDPTMAGVQTGCTRIVDPGDCGAYTFQGFRKNVVERTPTRVHSWLNAAALGGFMYGLYNTDVILNASMIDVGAAVEIIRMYPDIIRGIKTYSVPDAWGSPDGSEVIRRALEIGDLAHVPLYVHTGAPSLEGYLVNGGKPMLFGKEVTREQALTMILERLRPGDIIAHVGTTYDGGAWNRKENRPAPGVREAYDRGILFDSGRGAHFSYDSMRRMLDAGFAPFTLSTDRHAQDPHDKYVRVSSAGMCLHMSEMMALGMSLTDVITRASLNPAKALRITDRAGTIHVGKPAELTVLVEREGRWTLRDSPYRLPPTSIETKTLLTAVLTVLDDRVYPVNPAFLPDLNELQIQEDTWSWLLDRPERPTDYGIPGDDESRR
ncbi:MAG TPA: amidohydrolase family protein [Kofleriaceae bacterium]|nr:amidohydrolase family protein [Kofleriaceae bacterium]